MGAKRVRGDYHQLCFRAVFMGNHSAFSHNSVFNCICFQKQEHIRRPLFPGNFDPGFSMDYCTGNGDVSSDLENKAYMG